MFQAKLVEKIKTHILFSVFFFLKNIAVHKKIWKNIVEQGRPHIKIWRLRFACSIPKATNKHKHFM